MVQEPSPLPFADEGSPSAGGAAVAERILSSISLGLLTVGERLPPEIELAQQFGVAVNTLRKGLSELRDREIVVTRRGRSGGTFIVRAPFPSPDEVRERLRESSLVDLRDLRDEQVAVGSAIARLAATRAWGTSIERLATLAERVTRAATAAEAASADSRFHIELAVLAQSPRLLRAEVRIQSEMAPLHWMLADFEQTRSVVASDHDTVIRAVSANDGTAAALAMSEHLQHDGVRMMDAKLSIDPDL
jgi:DNA-binding FadR family transcriptional regulator